MPSRFIAIAYHALRNGSSVLGRSIMRRRAPSLDNAAVDSPATWPLAFAFAIEILTAFVTEVLGEREVSRFQIRDDKAMAEMAAYVKFVRALMIVGVPPLPGTWVERVDAGGCAGVWMTPEQLQGAPGERQSQSDHPRRVVMWIHGKAVQA